MKKLPILLLLMLLAGCDGDKIMGSDHSKDITPPEIIVRLFYEVDLNTYVWDLYHPITFSFEIDSPTGVAKITQENRGGDPGIITSLPGSNVWTITIANPTLIDRLVCIAVVANFGNEKKECFNLNITEASEIWVVRAGNNLYRSVDGGYSLIRSFDTFVESVSFLPDGNYMVDTRDKLYNLTPQGEIMWSTDLIGSTTTPLSDNSIVYVKNIVGNNGFPYAQIFSREINFDTGILGDESQETKNECDQGIPAPCFQAAIISGHENTLDDGKLFITGSNFQLISDGNGGNFPTNVGFWGILNTISKSMKTFDTPFGTAFPGGVNKSSNQGVLFRGEDVWIANTQNESFLKLGRQVYRPAFPYPSWPGNEDRWMIGIKDGNPIIIGHNEETLETIDLPFDVDEVWLQRF